MVTNIRSHQCPWRIVSVKYPQNHSKYIYIYTCIHTFTAETNPTSTSFPYFLPTIIPQNHALYFNKEYLPSNDMNGDNSPSIIDDLFLSKEKNEVNIPLIDLFPPKSMVVSSDNSTDLTRFPPNHQSSYDSHSTKTQDKNVLETSYIPPASGPVKVYPVYKPNSDFEPDLHVFPPNVNVTYKGTSFKVSPGSSYVPPASGIPGDIQPDGFKLGYRDYLPPNKMKEMFKMPSNLSEINDMSVKDVVDDEDLHAFPPNVDSNYKTKDKHNKSPVTSYVPPPSGVIEEENDDLSQSSEDMTSSHETQGSLAFPPNSDTEYLPPEMSHVFVGNSYVPPASGNVNDNPVLYLPPPTSPPPMPTTSVTKMTQTTTKPPVMISYLPPSAPPAQTPPPPPPPPPIMLPTPVPDYLPPEPKPPVMMPDDMSKPPMMMLGPDSPSMMMPEVVKLPNGMPWDGEFFISCLF